MLRRHYSDKQIIEGIKNGGTEENLCIRYLYKEYLGLIAKFVRENNGGEEEAQDIFQDAVVVFYEQVKSGKYELQAKISTYLYAVAKNLWFNKLKKNKRARNYRDTLTQQEKQTRENPLSLVLDEERSDLVVQMMQELKEDCRKILTLAIFEELPMKEIYPKMGYQNEQIARNKKYKCQKYLEKIILRSFSKADIKD